MRPAHLLHLLVASASIAALSEPITARAGCACGGWESPPALFDLCFKDELDSCTAGTWTLDGQYPLAAWNVFADVWRIWQSPVDTIAHGDGINSATFLSRAEIAARYGFAADDAVLAVTFTPGAAGDGNSRCPLAADMTCYKFGFDATYDVDVAVVSEQRWTTDEWQMWDDYAHGSGTLYDFDQVLTHEYGHALGLKHESRVPAVMSPYALPYRGVGLTSDDVAIARLAYPSRDTGFSDVAIGAYGFEGGTYSDVSLWPPVVLAGGDVLEVSRFIVYNRGAAPQLVHIDLSIDGAVSWSGTCDLGAYGTCYVNDTLFVPVPVDAYDEQSQVVAEAWTDAGSAAAIALGTVEVVPVFAQDRDGDGFAPLDGDCDDDDARAFPGAVEVCDGVDNDCDFIVDGDGDSGEPLTVACYEGASGTLGIGRCQSGFRQCSDGDFGACLDQIVPRAERCDGVDDDCDGQTDEGVTNACGTCGPAPAEVCNGVDDDCDGQTDEGATNACGTCGAVPPEVCNGVDDDCDGQTDEGVTNACGTCGAVPTEVCNGVDDDCDGQTDEGVTNACGTCGKLPTEVCNGVDDDCDGDTDEGVTNACGTCGAVPPESCNGVDDDCDGLTDEGVRNACGDCGAVPTEVCNGVDDDCDGLVDEGVKNACGGCGAVPAEVCNGVDDDCDGLVDEQACAPSEDTATPGGGDVVEPPPVVTRGDDDGGCASTRACDLALWGGLALGALHIRRRAALAIRARR